MCDTNNDYFHVLLITDVILWVIYFSYMLQYLMWRVLRGLNENITLNFMIVEHTKFGPDGAFGLIKKAYRHHSVSSLSKLSTIVTSRFVSVLGSAYCRVKNDTNFIVLPYLILFCSAHTNMVVNVGNEDGSTNVPVRDWQGCLSPYFRRLDGIKKYQYFRYI